MLILFSSVKADGEYIAENNGKQEFIDSCSLCHGNNAKGDGIFSQMLVLPTADLTQLSKNNNGNFPYKSVYYIIDGRNHIKEHGSRSMPIWGNRFQSTTWFLIDKGNAETIVSGKIFELLLYLESIQE
jgi:mono/diheme cytochrome c family protein